MAKSKTGKFSARAKDAVAGGGINGAIATIEKARVLQEFTYGGRFRDNPSAAIELTFDPGFEWKPENYSIGASNSWRVSKDGYTVVAIGNQEGLNTATAGYLLMKSIDEAAEAAGIDIDDLVPHTESEDGFSVEGLEGRTVRLAQVPFTTKGGDEKQKVVIGAFIVDAVAGKSNGGGKKATRSSDESAEEKTAAAVLALLEDTSRIKFADLGNLIFDAHRKDPDAKKMMKLAMTDEFVAGIEGVAFDKKKGVLTAAEEA